MQRNNNRHQNHRQHGATQQHGEAVLHLVALGELTGLIESVKLGNQHCLNRFFLTGCFGWAATLIVLVLMIKFMFPVSSIHFSVWKLPRSQLPTSHNSFSQLTKHLG